jgi:hypothetical protein
LAANEQRAASNCTTFQIPAFQDPGLAWILNIQVIASVHIALPCMNGQSKNDCPVK